MDIYIYKYVSANLLHPKSARTSRLANFVFESVSDGANTAAESKVDSDVAVSLSRKIGAGAEWWPTVETAEGFWQFRFCPVLSH